MHCQICHNTNHTSSSCAGSGTPTPCTATCKPEEKTMMEIMIEESDQRYRELLRRGLPHHHQWGGLEKEMINDTYVDFHYQRCKTCNLVRIVK